MSSVAAASTIAAYVSAIAAVAGAATAGVSANQQGKTQEAQARYNRDVELEAEKQAHQEESLNSTQHYRKVRHEIAAGQNLMAGFGNIGTTAEAALQGAYFNLSEDLSALRYRYGAEAQGHANAAKNYNYNKKTAILNRKIGVLSSSIKTVGAGAKGYTDLYEGGHI